MKKKILSILISVLAICTFMFTLSACGGGEPPHTHTFNKEVATSDYLSTNATCDKEAEYFYSCECGVKGTETFKKGSALGHAYSNWVSNGDNTHSKICANDNTHIITKDCSGGMPTETQRPVCKDCHTEHGESLGHVHILHLTKVDANAQSCTEEGNIEYYICDCGKWFTDDTATTEIIDKTSVVIEKDEHTHTIKKHNATEHWYECSCGDKIGIENHKGGTATETDKAVCSVCNQEYGESLGHVHALHLTKVDAKPQSCTKEGNKEYYTCSCGKWFTDDTATNEITDKSSVIVAKDKHNYATLKYDNESHWYECACGDKNSIENHKGGTATCTELAVCSVCSVEYGESAAHPLKSEWIYNETHHWHESTCDCEVKSDFEQHTLEDSGWCSVCEQAVLPTNGIYYEVSADGTYAEVIAYLGTSKKVNIASVYNDVPVTSIYPNAFENTAITTLIIPDSITSIGSDAFYGCRSLTRVEISNIAAWCTISFGNSYANPLYYAKNLHLNKELVKELVIPDNVTSIGSYAFYNCNNLTSITFPDSITSIGSNAFYGCSNLARVDVSDIVAWCNISFGNSYANPLYYAKRPYLNNALVKELVIPDGVESIGSYSFYNCTNLTSVTIPDSVTSIGSSVFYNCPITKATIPTLAISYIRNSNLKEVVITSGENIAASAFSSCINLTSVTISDSVISIAENAFYGCSSLIYNTYGTVKYLGNENNPYLVAISTVSANFATYELHDQTKILAGGVFENCTRLTSITIPNGVICIGDYAFNGCSSLTSVYYEGAESDWLNISIGSYNSCLINAVRYYYSLQHPTAEGYYWHYVDGLLTIWCYEPSDWIIELYPTKVEEGLKYRICSICNYVEKDIVPIPDTVTVTLNGSEISYEYEVSFNLNGGEGAVPATQIITSTNALYYPRIPSKSDYVFAGWYTNRSCSGDPFDFSAEVTEDTVLYAKWIACYNRYQFGEEIHIYRDLGGIRFGFVPLTDSAHFYCFGGSITLSVKESGYDGKVIKTASYDSFNYTTSITCDVTPGKLYYLEIHTAPYYDYAKTRVYNYCGEPLGGGKCGTYMETTELDYYENFNLTVPQKAGYIFGGWYDGVDGTGTQYTDANGVSTRVWDKMEDTTLYAHWIANETANTMEN